MFVVINLQLTFGLVFLDGSYSARISRTVSLSSPKITSVHLIGNAYLHHGEAHFSAFNNSTYAETLRVTASN